MDWAALTLFLLITGRMTGCVVFNPLLGRRGIPGMIKAGFVLLLLFAAPTGPVHESVGFIPFIPFRFVVPL